MIVKVCGMREADNIREVEQAGAAWMGFIFYPRSPRFVDICPDYLPEQALRVGVFVNETADEILRRVKQFGLHFVQLHGKETPEFCTALKSALKELPEETVASAQDTQHTDAADRSETPQIIKAFSIASAEDIERTQAYEAVCDYFLFDTACAGYGGSGQRFDWSLLEGYQGSVPFLLSGGIKADHLEALNALHHPRWCGIDLNSGFETAPAQKDATALKHFIQAFHATHQA